MSFYCKVDNIFIMNYYIIFYLSETLKYFLIVRYFNYWHLL